MRDGGFGPLESTSMQDGGSRRRERRVAPRMIPRWKQSRARVYADVNRKRPQSYWDYENITLKFNSPDGYEIIRKVGRGKYSEVFEGWDVKNQRLCVIKVLKPVKKKKILREYKVLQNLNGGSSDIVQLYDVVRDPETKWPSFIFECVNNTDFKILYPRLTDYDIRFYMFKVLKALDYSHSNGIMHRDIKPHNVMIDHEQRKLRVIDWGLAEFYHPGTEYNVRVASRHYKGPELLVDLRTYDYSLDMWSFGCMLGGIIFKKIPFFHGRDNDDQLVKIVQFLGSEEFLKYVHKYDLNNVKLDKLVSYAGTPWSSFQRMENHSLITPEVIDLLSKLLRFDHQERLTAKEAMMHPYFEPVRGEEGAAGEPGAEGEATATTTSTSTSAAPTAVAPAAAPSASRRSDEREGQEE
eukprot:gnl/Trimastix_PCT/580.p1 GENE.gnl/Trimastix_PCT/580~~gnl/Trimastix_PCT/580.p1  ORF type:complete len:427 (-),score=114.35 gnl/Trimastix_PCT/580:31-1257(-)